MADIRVAFEKMLKLEFNSPANALHFNEGENGYTFMGIYEYAHPMWSGWEIVHAVLAKEKSLAKASVVLYFNMELRNAVLEFYKKSFWDKMRLSEVRSQNTAEEVFVFGVNAGISKAIKLAQKVVGVSVDGVIGSKTLEALNKFDEAEFSAEYDVEEIKYYEGLVAGNSNFRKYLTGWKNRAVAI